MRTSSLAMVIAISVALASVSVSVAGEASALVEKLKSKTAATGYKYLALGPDGAIDMMQLSPKEANDRNLDLASQIASLRVLSLRCPREDDTTVH